MAKPIQAAADDVRVRRVRNFVTLPVCSGKSHLTHSESNSRNAKLNTRAWRPPYIWIFLYFHSAVDGLVHFLTTLREILLHCTLEISKYFPFSFCSADFCQYSLNKQNKMAMWEMELVLPQRCMSIDVKTFTVNFN